MDVAAAKKHLADALTENGGLDDVSRYLSYAPGNDTATLDGQFTADDLEAIAVVMRSSEAT